MGQLGRGLALVCLLAMGANALRTEYGACHDLSCASRETLLDQIKLLKTNLEVKEEILDDSECTACYSNPCLNGGDCGAGDDIYHYRCDCPFNTTGTNCEQVVKCESWTCGENTECNVQNHQANCVCKRGYSGNPKAGCKFAGKKICFNGDPHYTTFDGAYYSYQSTCPYVFSQPCTNLTNGYPNFVVKAKNEVMQNSPQTVAYVESCQVEIYDKTIFVDQNFKVYIDGLRVYIPYYYPSQSLPQISISLRGNEVVIKTMDNIEVDFSSTQLCLTVPDIPEFQGGETLCGLAGNLDRNCNNDMKIRNGTILPIAGCYPDQDTVDSFADTWETHDYLISDRGCVPGRDMTHDSPYCDKDNNALRCVAIQDADNGEGVFAACKDLGHDFIQNAYSSCIYDVCQNTELLCANLIDFAHECQYQLPSVDLTGWRDGPESYCPSNCPANTEYQGCVSSCPATCSDHDAPETCYEPCYDGCACKFGYVLDNSQPEFTTCVRIQECGCKVPETGEYHLADDVWLTDDCTQTNTCSNGTYIEGPYACPQYTHCGVENYASACVCDDGFERNATTGACVDIDECLDPTTCGAADGHGTCTNTIGSYTCSCNQYYEEPHCLVYGPSRHCADLFVYHNIREDGLYTVHPPYPDGKDAPIDVWCEMKNSDGSDGGWTLIGNALTNETSGRPLADYVLGFGHAEEKSVWLGLKLMNLYTNYQPSNLRLNLFRCAHNAQPAKWTDCTYPTFVVRNETQDYAVKFTEPCRGTEIEYNDGWARWNLENDGPGFVAMDNDPSDAHCSESFRNTGWWFWADQNFRCGEANLNGVRYVCDEVPEDQLQTYLWWGGAPLNKAEMLLRPAGFPNYDSSHV